MMGWTQSANVDNLPILSVTIEGNKRVPTEDIMGRIKSQPGYMYNRSQVREDVKSLNGMGYFNDVAVDAAPAKDGIRITFFLKENPVVQELALEGNTSVKTKRLKNELDFTPGKLVYREGIMDGYIDKIKEYYKQREFSAQVEGRTEKINDDQIRIVLKITEEKKGKIIRIEFAGNKAISTKKLRKTISSKNSWLWNKYFFDTLKYEDDVNRIESAYKDKGYVLIKVVAEDPVMDPDRKGLVLKFNITEGPRFNNHKISVTGNQLFTIKETQDILKQKTGNPYSQAESDADLERLNDMYADQGYWNTNVDKLMSVDTPGRFVDMDYLIHEGNRSYVGDVVIKGVAPDKDPLFKSEKGYEEVGLKTKSNVILREVTLEPGDVFRKRDLDESKRRLMNLRYFDRVIPTEEPTLAMDTRDLVLYMIEKKTGGIYFGVGYDSQLKAFIDVNFNESNIKGTGRSINVKADLAEKGSYFNIAYTEPYILDTRVSGVVNIFRNVIERYVDGTMIVSPSTTNRHYYDEDTYGGSVVLYYPVNRNLQASLGLSVKKTSIRGVDGYIVPSLLGPMDAWTNSIIPGIVYDTRDNNTYPTRGARYEATAQLASKLLAGDINFIKLYAEGNWFKSIFGDMVLASRARGGYLSTYGGTKEVPISDRFYLGGPSSLRGFNERGVSPSITYIDPNYNESTQILLGGDVMMNLSVELRRRFMKEFSALIFVDAGGVWPKPDDFNLSDIRVSAGPGVLLDLPFGSFQVGYGFRLKKKTGDDTQGFYFNFGSTF